MSFLGGIIGGIGSAIGGIFGDTAKSVATGATSYEADRRLMEKSQAFNSREASIARDFNSAEALKARNFAAAERAIAHDYGTAERVAAQAFSARQAQQQMDFQGKFASTQYQRAVKDLDAAGLNRILALGSPAAAPAGAMATSAGASAHPASAASASGSAASHGGSPGSGGAAVRNAIGLASAVETIRTQRKNQELLDAQAYKTREEGRATRAESDRSETLNIPFSILMDMAGRSGDAARYIRELVESVQDRTGGSVPDLWNRGKDAVRTIYIRRGNDSHKR